MHKSEVLDVVEFLSSWLIEGEIDVNFLKNHNNRDFVADEYLRWKSGLPFTERVIDITKKDGFPHEESSVTKQSR